MIQWEYRSETPYFGIYKSEEEYLEENGKDGWELVSVIWNHNLSQDKKFYFKRPIPQPSTAEKIFNDVKNEVEGIPMAAFDEHPPCTCGTDELCRIHSV